MPNPFASFAQRLFGRSSVPPPAPPPPPEGSVGIDLAFADGRDLGIVPTFAQRLDGLIASLLAFDRLTPDQVQQVYRSTVALLVGYRARHFAPHLAGLIVERPTDDDDLTSWERVERDHPWQRIVRRPCPEMPPLLFYELASLLRDTMGSADFYVERAALPVPGTRLTVPDVPVRLWPLWPEFGYLEPQLDALGRIPGYTYWRADGARLPLDASEVLRLPRIHPLAPHRTLSLVHAAAYEIDQDLAANVYGRDAMESRGIPDVALETTEDLSGAEGKRKLVQASADFAKMFRLKRDRRLVPVSHSGMAIKPLALSQKDQEFTEQRKFLKTVLFQLFETHEGLFAKDATRANAEAALYGFSLNTVLPNVQAIASAMEHGFERLFGADPDALRLALPPNVVPEDRTERLRNDRQRIETGTPINRVLAERGEDPVEGGDVPLVAKGLVSLQRALAGDAPSDPLTEDDLPADQQP